MHELYYSKEPRMFWRWRCGGHESRKCGSRGSQAAQPWFRQTVMPQPGLQQPAGRPPCRCSETAEIDSAGNFHFNPAAPGQYELQAVSTNGRFNSATYQPLSLDRDQPNLSLALSNYPTIQFAFEDTKGVPIDGRQFQVLLRHQDLAGAGKPETMRGVSEAVRGVVARTGVLPGRYDVALGPAPAWYVVSVSGPRPEGPRRSE